MTDKKAKGPGSLGRPPGRSPRVQPFGGQLSLPLWEPGDTSYQGAKILAWRPAEPAESALDEATPDAPHQAFERAASAYEDGDLELAVALYREVVEHAPDDATALFNLGVALEEAGEHDDAVVAYTRATQVEPSFTDAWWNAARLHEKHGRNSLAIQCLKEYKRHAPPGSGEGSEDDGSEHEGSEDSDLSD